MKYIFEDKEVWRDHLLKNYKYMNETMGKGWSDEQINQMIDAKMNNTVEIERYKKALEFKSREAKGAKILEDFKKEFLKTHDESQYNNLNGFAPFIYCKLDLSGAPGSREKNFEIMTKYTDRSWAMKEVMGQYNKMLNADPTKYIYNTPEEGFKLLENDYDFITTCFSLSRMFSSIGNYELNPELKSFFDEHTKLIECISSPMSMQNIYTNPSRLLMPDEGYVELMACGKAYGKMAFDLIGKYEGFSLKVGSRDLEESITYACIQSANEQLTMKEEHDCFGLVGKEAPKDIMSYKCAMVNGEKTTLMGGLEGIRNKKGKVEFIKYTEEEQAKIDHALSHALLDEPAMIEAGKQLKDLGKTLLSTDKWYNWNNTPEFKELAKAIKQLPTNNNEFHKKDKFVKNFEKIQTLAQKYVDKREGKTLNENGTLRMNICKNILEFTKKSLADDFFHKIVPNQDLDKVRVQQDFTKELEETEDILDLDNPLEKTISLEKGSEEELEFFNC